MKAILGRDTASAVHLFIDLTIEGVFGAHPHGPGAWHVGRELAAYVGKFPELKAELKRRYESAALTGPARAALEHFFGEAGDEDDLIAMIAKYSANGQPYDSPMAAVVRAVVLGREPVEAGSSSFYIHPASVKRMRSDAKRT